MNAEERFNYMDNQFRIEMEIDDESELQTLIGSGKIYEKVSDFAIRNFESEIELLLLYRIERISQPIAYWKLTGKDLEFIKKEKFDEGEIFGRLTVQGSYLYAISDSSLQKALSWFTYSESLMIASSLKASLFTIRHNSNSWRNVYRLENQRDITRFTLPLNEKGM